MFCSISYTKDSLWALTRDAWSLSSTLHDRRLLAVHVPATGDVCLVPSWFLWSPFSVFRPCPLEGRSVLLYTCICFQFELGSIALWKRIIFQSFVGPQDISVHEGKEYPPFAAFQVSSHSNHFSQLQFIIGGLCVCCIPLTALSHKVTAKKHSTPKRPPPLYMAWITVNRRLKKKKGHGEEWEVFCYSEEADQEQNAFLRRLGWLGSLLDPSLLTLMCT